MSQKIIEMLSPADRAWVDEVLDRANTKLVKVRERSAKKLPSEAQNGVHDNKLEAKGPMGIAKGFWTNGFWAGMLWQMYAETGDERYKEIARFTLPILDECLLEMDTHDIGFPPPFWTTSSPATPMRRKAAWPPPNGWPDGLTLFRTSFGHGVWAMKRWLCPRWTRPCVWPV